MATQSKTSRARRVMQAGAILVALGAGYAIHDVRVSAQNGGGTTPPTQKEPVVATQATRDAAATQNAFVDVAQAVQPAVVTIVTAGARPTKTSNNGNGRSRRFPSPFGNPAPDGGDGEEQSAPNVDPNSDFQQFFKRFQRDFGLQGQSYEPNSFAGRVLRKRALIAFRQVQEGGGGLGSGMIYRSDGLILTNAHVVRGATTVSVTLSDGRKFDKAKVLGRDERTDIAVVKVEAQNLPTVKLGDSDETRVGDWAIAVGNPFGLDHTLTVGVISARARELNLAINQDTRTDYLQTDASINPGNSGGPLLDIYGRVIGVNNAIYSESGGNQGIGFAIPVNTARFVADQLASNGRVRRGYLGVSIRSVEDVAVAYGLDPNLKGVLIEAISDPNGPGAKAGLRPGDVITKFNDQSVSKSSELQRLVGNAPIGSTITLDVVRGGKTVQLKAVTQELKDSPAPKTGNAAPAPDPGTTNGTSTAIPGLKTKNLSADVARALGIKITRGVVVTQVEEGSPSDDAGLQRGDVIEQVGQTAVSSVTDMNAQIAQILGRQNGTGKKVALYINRNGERSSVIIALD
ncbi:periplasmic serine endoprotease DegP [Abditibacteriota bacterium]|nr:periplasmic serine endoprotease DegP [Abditibacteriota bacterium]